jgi:hypothetical protein
MMALKCFWTEREPGSEDQYLMTAKLRQIDDHGIPYWKKSGNSPSLFPHLFIILDQEKMPKRTFRSDKTLKNFRPVWCHHDAWLYTRT